MVGGVEPGSLEDQPDRRKDPPGRAAADGTWSWRSANRMVDLKQVIAACATVFIQRHQQNPLSAIISIYRNALPRCQYSPARPLKRSDVGPLKRSRGSQLSRFNGSTLQRVNAVAVSQARSVPRSRQDSCQTRDVGRQR